MSTRRLRTWEAGGRLVVPTEGLRWFVLDGGAASERVAAQLDAGEWVNPLDAYLRALGCGDPEGDPELLASMTRGLAWV